MSEGRIDTAIDRAVREMLDVEPPADLRAKVIARLDAPGGFAFGWKLFIRLLIPIAAAAIVIVAVALARRAEAPVKLRSVATDQVLPSPQPGPQNVASVPTPTRSLPVAARSTVTATVAAALGPETSATGIEPLNTISPIEVAPITPRSITPDPIGVRPLDPITEMQIAPLNPPDRRD
jgi:hypothetical protein